MRVSRREIAIREDILRLLGFSWCAYTRDYKGIQRWEKKWCNGLIACSETALTEYSMGDFLQYIVDLAYHPLNSDDNKRKVK